MKRIAKPLFAVLFGVVWALILVEIGARYLAGQGMIPSRMAQDIFAPHAVGWAMQRNLKATIPSATGLIQVSINRDGFRDNNYPKERSDAKRIIVLGDSYTAAIETHQDQTFHHLLEQSYGGSAEVYSLGVTAYQTTQELLVYEAVGSEYQPDEVILMLYIGNDLLGNNPRDDAPYITLNEDGSLERHNYPWTGDYQMHAIYGKPSTPLMKLSQAAFLVGIMQEWIPAANAPEKEAIDEPVESGDGAAQLADAGYCEFTTIANYSHIDEANWEIDEALLLALRDAVTADGATFRVAIIPAEFQVHPDYEAEFLEVCPRPETFGDPPIQDHLHEFFEANDIEYLDLLEPLSAAREETGLAIYLPGLDTHWTPQGHAAVADALKVWLDGE